MTIEEVVDVLRGKPGTTVKLGISRGAKTLFEVTLTRSTIHVQSVKSKLQPNGVGYVRLTQFAEDTASGLVTALTKLKNEAGGHLKGLVVDLRNDPGGLLSSAIDVASQFLDRGTVVAIRGRLPNQTQVFQVRRKGDTLRDTPVVVLINGAFPPHEVVSSGIAAGSRPTFPLGKADGTVEETGASTRCTAGVGDPASKNRLLEITSGSCRGQQGLVTTCKTLQARPKAEGGESPTADEPVRAKTEE
jgi:hypothetical protein